MKKIVHGDSSAPFHIRVYDKREDFDFRIVNFPFTDSNIPATPAYGVYVSQLGFVQPRQTLCTDSVAYLSVLNNKALNLRYSLNQLKHSSNIIAQQWLNIM